MLAVKCAQAAPAALGEAQQRDRMASANPFALLGDENEDPQPVAPKPAAEPAKAGTAAKDVKKDGEKGLLRQHTSIRPKACCVHARALGG